MGGIGGYDHHRELPSLERERGAALAPDLQILRALDRRVKLHTIVFTRTKILRIQTAGHRESSFRRPKTAVSSHSSNARRSLESSTPFPTLSIAAMSK